MKAGLPMNADPTMFNTLDTARSDTLDSARAELSKKRGPEYWKSLEELAQTPAFRERIAAEFPSQAAATLDNVSRRNFLQVMGASLALAGVTTGCARQPEEAILPYVKSPEEVLPGMPLYFASSVLCGGYAQGVLVESNMGRPVKIEGHPEHPGSLGGTSAQAQASLLNLYDPERAKAVEYYDQPSGWDEYVIEARGILSTLQPRQGEGIRILTETVTSPSLAASIQAFLAANSKAQWHQFEPVTRDGAREGSQLAFGEIVDTRYHFEAADVVVSLDSDFLGSGPAHVRYSRDFAHRRDVVDHHEGGHGELIRMYAIESTPTMTGFAADHRLPVRPSRVETLARAIAAKMGVPGVAASSAELTAEETKWVDAIAADLQAHRGHAIVIAGDQQPGVVHAIAHAINHAGGNVGQTVFHSVSAEVNPTQQGASLKSLVEAMAAGQVEYLIMIDGNPVYNAPIFPGLGTDGADLTFGDALRKVRTRAHLATHQNETSELCQWFIPRLHELETWGDARAFDGTVSLIQPLIAPFYEGKSPLELMSAHVDKEERSAYDIVRAHWQGTREPAEFEKSWAESLGRGMIADTASETKTVRLASATFASSIAASSSDATSAEGGYDVVFPPDPMIGDGRYADNAWLQEIPKPLTKITWDNAVYMSMRTAESLGAVNGDMVEVTIEKRRVSGPVWIQPGHADNTLTLHLGYGRRIAGKVGKGMGFDVYPLRSALSTGFVSGANVRKTAGTYLFSVTEEHYNIAWQEQAEDRALIREYTTKEYAADPEIVHHAAHDFGEDFTLYDDEEKVWDGNKWGMTIDLNKCTGCSACIVACQAENNIPVVGKAEVRRGREMHWIRVDRYYKGDPHNPRAGFQPLLCMQCENAPCEVVCPVGATQHTAEGLNDMVYNRCIGTRYCSNNCPYKVRRFNFYNYSRTPLGKQGERMWPLEGGAHIVYPESIKPMYNPEVTVRTRGVMEKCTYCVQRINSARIEAKKQGLTQVPDGAVRTACEQACPSAAIAFGNLNAPNSRVAELKASHRNYSILADLNTRPRTTYLARLTNPNEALTPPAAAETHVAAGSVEHEA